MRRDRRGFRAERLPEFRRIDFVEPDAERRTVEGVEDRHGIAVRNPYTTADAYHCVTNNARKVHRLPKGKRYTIQLSVIRIKSKRLRVVFSAVF